MSISMQLEINIETLISYLPAQFLYNFNFPGNNYNYLNNDEMTMIAMANFNLQYL